MLGFPLNDHNMMRQIKNQMSWATSNSSNELKNILEHAARSFKMIGIYFFKKIMQMHKTLFPYMVQTVDKNTSCILAGIYLFRGNFNPTRELGLSIVLIDTSILWPNFTV